MSTDERWNEAWNQRERLLRIARRRVPTYQDAEDVVAEAIQRAGGQEDLPISAVPAWTTRVTINLCTDRQRRLATQRALLLRPELRPEPMPSHEDDVVTRAQARWVVAEVDALPARQAFALRLRAEGLDNAGIAARLGVSVATVEGLVKRSRVALRQALRAAGAAVGVAWASLHSSRRSTALVLAVSSVVLLVVAPWSTDPVPSSPGQAGPPPPISRLPLGDTDQVSPPTRSGRSLLSGPVALPARPAGQAGPNPLIGTAVPYTGPKCLAVYCLPIVDAEADKTFGATAPQGWSPADLRDYLGEPAFSDRAAARRPLVAVLSWYSFPWIEDDLAVYRSTFNLPTCDVQNGCLQIHRGDDVSSPDDVVWGSAMQGMHAASARAYGQSYGGNPAPEQAQMLQSISAACPECRLALVTASSDYGPNMVEAVKLAKGLGADVIVTTLSVLPADSEFNLLDDGSGGPLRDSRLYDGGPLVLAGGGTGGFDAGGGGAPRRFANVVSVGGTVVEAGAVIADEDNASFCNVSITQPTWQQALDTGCPGRAGVDLVLPAGSETGLSIYVGGGIDDGRGWFHPGHHAQAVAVFGALFARHGLASVVRGPADLYAHPEWFVDIVEGDVNCLRQGCSSDVGDFTGCQPSAPQLCTARRGWDGATGLGEPRHLPWF